MNNNENEKNNLLFRRIDLSDTADKSQPAENAPQSEQKKKRNNNRRRRKPQAKANLTGAAEKGSQNEPKQAAQDGKKANASDKNAQPRRKKKNPTAQNEPKQTVKAASDKPQRPQPKRGRADNGNKLKIIPLGGLGEVGKNMTVYEYGNDAFIVDCGLKFPDDELFGIDIVIPDFTYALEIKDKLRGMIITHGHEDHIGAIPYFIKELNIPIYGTKLTIGFIRAKLPEHKLENVAKLNTVEIGDKIKMGCMSVETIRVNHSIPGAMALAINTPVGVVIQTGDFKVDYTPVFDKTIDLVRFGQLGSEGVLALLSDSTNVEHPGNSVTESNVGNALEMLFSRAEGKRLIIATFASNIQRVQQILDLAKRHNRKIAFSGRSMENNTAIATELGYLTVDEDLIISVDQLKNYRPSDVIIITTGSQGEPLSALSRMAAGTHKQVSITGDDMIIISATPIPGNEKAVTRIINGLLKLGSDVIYESMYEAHASGHACQDELKLMMQLTKPQYFIPVHGEYKHLVKHANLAKSLGIPEKNVLVADIGMVIELDKNSISSNKTVTAGRVLVDGLGVGDVGTAVLRDRKHLSEDGLIVVVVSVDASTHEMISGPDIISRGFIYVKEAEELIGEAKQKVKDIIAEYSAKDKKVKTAELKVGIREELGKMMYQRTMRNPMILPVVMEI